MSDSSMGAIADLQQVFGKKLYALPLNQRPYSWSSKQCEELFNDIYNLPTRKNLFLGSVILSNENRTVRDHHQDLISVLRVEDGQQRLTSLFLLIAALKSAMSSHGSGQDLIDKYEGMITYQNAAGDVLFKIENNFKPLEDDFNEVVKKGASGKPRHPAGKRLMKSFEYFQGRIERLKSKSKVEALAKKVSERVFLSLVELDKKFDIELTFEGMNSRGLGLSQLDKIKNFAILIISKKPDGLKLDRDTFVEDTWFKTIQSLDNHGLSGHTKEDQFIFDCACTFEGKDIEGGPSKIHDWFKNKFGCLVHGESAEVAKSLNDFMSFWKKYINSYALVMGASPLRSTSSRFNREGLAWVDRIQRTGRRHVGHQILVAAFHKYDKEKFAMVAQFVELYIFRLLINQLSKVRVTKNKSIFFECAHEIIMSSRGVKETLETIWGCVKDEKDLPLRKLVDDLFTRKDMYCRKSGWKDSKYFLYEYDGCVGNVKPIVPWENLRETNQEHIIPQSVLVGYKQDWSYCYSGDKTVEDWVKDGMHSLGNLALIDSKTNSELQDKSFKHKKTQASRCYRDDTATLRQVVEIAGNTRNFHESLMSERIIWMKAFTAIRWTFPVKDDIQKTEKYLQSLGMSSKLEKHVANKLLQLRKAQKQSPSF